MKHLKMFENFKDMTVGDIVVAINSLDKNNRGYELIGGEKYKILNVDDSFFEVETLDGKYEGFFLKRRFLPELEYKQYKYNL
jgi:hypothetical protein